MKGLDCRIGKRVRKIAGPQIIGCIEIQKYRTCAALRNKKNVEGIPDPTGGRSGKMMVGISLGQGGGGRKGGSGRNLKKKKKRKKGRRFANRLRRGEDWTAEQGDTRIGSKLEKGTGYRDCGGRGGRKKGGGKL